MCLCCFFSGVCTLGAVLCFASGMYMLQKSLPPPPGVRGDYGWSFFLACVSSPLQVMAGALFLWASRASRREYSLMKAYRVAWRIRRSYKQCSPRSMPAGRYLGAGVLTSNSGNINSIWDCSWCSVAPYYFYDFVFKQHISLQWIYAYISLHVWVK